MASNDGYVLGELKAGFEDIKRRLEHLEDKMEDGGYSEEAAPAAPGEDPDMLTRFMNNPDQAVAFGQMAGAVLKGLLPKPEGVTVETEAQVPPASHNGSGDGELGEQKT